MEESTNKAILRKSSAWMQRLVGRHLIGVVMAGELFHAFRSVLLR